MDALENDTKEEKTFTIVSLPAVIWARVGESSLTVRVQGEPTAVTINGDDELFNFYRDKFIEHKTDMLKPAPQGEQLKLV